MTLPKHFFAKTNVKSFNLNCSNNQKPVTINSFAFEHKEKWNVIKISNCIINSMQSYSFGNIHGRAIFFNQVTFPNGIDANAFKVTLMYI